jgi:hypothetical protein
LKFAIGQLNHQFSRRRQQSQSLIRQKINAQAGGGERDVHYAVVVGILRAVKAKLSSMTFRNLLITALLASLASAQTRPATQPAKLPFIDLDIPHKQVRVECEAIECKNALEFFCCVKGTNEHEAVLRSQVKPSHLHLALLLIGLEPGEGIHYSEKEQKWIAPTGNPIKIRCMFQRDGKTITVPAEQMMRDAKTKKPMTKCNWVFAGSRIMNGGYAADSTGYLVSIVNFELTVVDVAEIARSANETLEWEVNPDMSPPKGTKVTMILESAH